MSTPGESATMIQPPVPPPPSAAGLPRSWPSAWPSCWPALVQRAALVAMVDLLTLLGLVVAADPGTQWWALFPPLLLLAGPVTRPARIRRRAARAAATGRLAADPDGVVLLHGRSGWRQFARIRPDGQVHYLR